MRNNRKVSRLAALYFPYGRALSVARCYDYEFPGIVSDELVSRLDASYRRAGARKSAFPLLTMELDALVRKNGFSASGEK